MKVKRLIAIGGGESKGRETAPPDSPALAIDAYIAAEAKRSAGERRPCGLFIPTASHDCMPYYNTFHKVYTGRFGCKTDVLLLCNREPDPPKWREKFARADFVYVGGGDTIFMLEEWKKKGLSDELFAAYERGTLICGLSAGAICWFEEMYSDSVEVGSYAMADGLGWIEGKISPHYDERMLDFDEVVRYNRIRAWGIENDAALEFADGLPVKVLSAGGRVWQLDGTSGTLKKAEFTVPERAG